MRGTFILVLVVLTSPVLLAQEREQQPPKPPSAAQVLYNHYARTYQAALRYNDYAVAKEALYNMLVENPRNDSILYSLSVLYFQSQQYASAALTANDIITMNPDNVGALEISANALESLGAKDKALDRYETLYLKTDDNQVLYKIAFLQYELARYEESNTNTDILLGKDKLADMKVVFNTDTNEQKEYPIKVALLNLKGLISKEKGEKAKAISYFEQALTIAPDFVLAKKGLASLEK